MVQRRGLLYEIVSTSRLAGHDAFLKKTAEVRQAWRDLRQTVAQPLQTQATAKGLRNMGREAPKIAALAQSLRSIRDSLLVINRLLGKTVAGFKKVGTQATVASTQISTAARNTATMGVTMADLTRKTGNWVTRLKRAGVILVRILSIFAVFRALQFGAQAITGAIREAFRFAASIEEATLSVRALLLALADVRTFTGEALSLSERFAATQAIARREVLALRVEGLRTAATFEQLLNTFQTALGPGLSAGLAVQEVRRLAVLVSQAASAIGVPQDQLAEEIRALLTGAISPRFSRIATVLQVTPEDVRNARETGQLFEFLLGRLGSFAEAAEASLDNLNTKLVNFRDLLGQILAEGLGGTFQRFKDVIDEVAASIGTLGEGGLFINPEVERALQQADLLLTAILDSVVRLAQAAGARGLANAFSAISNSIRAILPLIEQILTFVINVGNGFFAVADVLASAVNFVVQFQQALAGATGSAGVQRASLESIAKVLGGILALWVLIKGAMLLTSGIQKVMLVTTQNWAKALAAARVASAGIAGSFRLLLRVVLPLLAFFLVLTLEVLPLFNKRVKDALLRTEAFGRTFGGIIQEIALRFLNLRENFATVMDAVERLGVAAFTRLKNAIIRLIGEAFISALSGIRAVLDSTIGGFIADKVFGVDAEVAAASINGLIVATAVSIALATDEAEKFKDILDESGRAIDVQNALLDRQIALVRRVEKIVKESGESISFADFLRIELEELGKIITEVERALIGAGDVAEEDFIDAFLLGVNAAKQALDDLAKEGEKAFDELFLAQRTAGLDGFARDVARASAELELLGQKTRASIVADISSLKAELESITGDDADSERRIVQLNAQIAGLEGALANLETQTDRVAATRIAALARELATTREIANERLAIESEIEASLLGLRIAAINDKRAAADLEFAERLAQLETERQLVEARFRAEADGLQAAIAAGAEGAEISAAILALEQNRLLELGQIADKEALILALIEKQQRRRDDPSGAAFDEVFGFDPEAAFNSAKRIFTAFRDGLAQTLAGALTDALFNDEATLTERFRSFMQRLAQIMLEEFIKVKLLTKIFDVPVFGGGGGGGDLDIGGPAAGGWVGRSIKMVKNGLGHWAGAAARFGVQAFSKGGRPYGLPSSDTIPAMLTEGEYVHPVSSVKKYGTRFMEMVRSGRLSPVLAQALTALGGGGGLSLTRIGRTSRGVRFAQSGGIADGGFTTGGVTIVNAVTADMVAGAMAGAAGQRVILNTLLSTDEFD